MYRWLREKSGATCTIRDWAADPEIDLGSLARHANGNTNKTILFEMIDIATHTAYHLGEFGILRQVMGLWPEEHEQERVNLPTGNRMVKG